MGGFKSYCIAAAAALASSTVALPLPLLSRQTWTGLTAHDFSFYGCRPVILIFARETYSPGNMVSHPRSPSSRHIPTTNLPRQGFQSRPPAIQRSQSNLRCSQRRHRRSGLPRRARHQLPSPRRASGRHSRNASSPPHSNKALPQLSSCGVWLQPGSGPDTPRDRGFGSGGEGQDSGRGDIWGYAEFAGWAEDTGVSGE